MQSGLGIVWQHIGLSINLFLRFGLALTAIWAAGTLLTQLLLRLAVEVGFFSRLLGLLAISPVILAQLVIYVAFFVILRQGLPNIRFGRWRRQAEPASHTSEAENTPVDSFSGKLLIVLIPFYGYYAGWGFLGDTLRNYSQIFYGTQLRRIDFSGSEFPPTALEIGQTGWVILGVAAVWLVRRLANLMQKRSGAAFWPLLVVACEATWVLLGLYVISGWQAELAQWLATLPSPGKMLGSWLPAAAAAASDIGARPVDWAPAFQPWPFLVSLFWYALLPLVWFNLGAIVYGHDLHGVAEQTERLARRAISRWQWLPKPVRDFIGHFWAGLVRRWNAVVNGVLLAAAAGITLTVSVLVLWRLVDWLGNWAWIGLAGIIGPQDTATWQVLSVPLNALFGSPGGPPGGLLVSPLQFCVLAAGLELASRARDREVSQMSGQGSAV